MKFLLATDKFNSSYQTFVKYSLRGHDVRILKGSYDILSIYLKEAKKLKVDAIILANPSILKKLVGDSLSSKPPSLQDWAGASFEVQGVKIIVSRPFKQLITTPTGEFILRWYIRKHFSPSFLTTPELLWQETDSTRQNIKALYNKFKEAIYIAVDIETTRKEASIDRITKAKKAGWPVQGIYAYGKLQTASGKNSTNSGWFIPQITMIGYCGLFKDTNGKLQSLSIVLHINSMEDIKWMRKFNRLSAPKITQNGGYEATHLIRYNAPLYNWTCDTFHLMHSWFAELPRTLNFISSMFLKNYQYWKDESEFNMPLYNAKDTYTTLWNWVIMCTLAPDWAKNNYLIEFRKCFPAITCGLEGFKVDIEERDRLREYYNRELDNIDERLQKIVYKGFNYNSSQQVLALINSLSLGKKKTADAKALEKFGEEGELQFLLAELITTAREYKKKLSTYINTSLMDGRLLYEINHGGTDTGRASSKASNLWVGTQIQNQDNKLRSMYIADDGWEIANCDGSQAESRTTAYISGDKTLINTVETAKDFHKRNASLFFGIPEDEIEKPIRDLSKRVNHGSNYNMMANKLLQTMGSKNVLKARELLELPKIWGLKKVCEYLLQTFIETYPDVKGSYYDNVIENISTKGLLTVANGWTRRCFGNPSREMKDKLDLNKYVAHSPQCLSVMLVDEAEFDFWLEFQIRRNIIRLKAQVHDEVVYMVKKENYEITKPALSNLMSRPINVTGCDGVERELIIPNDGGSIAFCWGDLKD